LLLLRAWRLQVSVVDGESYSEAAASNYSQVRELLKNDDVRLSKPGLTQHDSLLGSRSAPAAGKHTLRGVQGCLHLQLTGTNLASSCCRRWCC
jgi:hypothetical protein